MRIECGTVVDIHNGYAILELMPQDACASCTANHACSALGGGKKRISIKNSLNARKGDSVEFAISDRGGLISATLVYGLPVLCMISGMLLGSIAHRSSSLSSDSAVTIGGAAGIILAFVIIKLINPVVKNREVFRPRMVRIVVQPNSQKEM